MRPWIVVATLLVILATLPLLVLRSERATIAVAETAVEWLTPYRLVLSAPEIRPYEGRIRATELHLYPAIDDGPPFLSVLDLRVSRDDSASGWPSLTSLDLQAAQVTVYVSSRDATADPLPRNWMRPAQWLPAQFRIAQLHVINAGADTQVLRLQRLHGQRLESGTVRVTAESDQRGEPFSVALDLSSVATTPVASRLDMQATLTSQHTDSWMHLRGSITGSDSALDYQLELSADYTDIGQLLPDIEGVQAIDGHVVLTATLTGDGNVFALRGARLLLDNMPDYGVEAFGDIHYTRGVGGTLDLRAAGDLATFPQQLALPGLNLDKLGNLRASASIAGPWQRPQVSDLLLRSENFEGLSLTLRGRVNTDLNAFRDNELQVDIVGPSLAVLEPWVGKLPVDPGPFAAAGRLRSHDDDIALEDLVIEVGRPGEAILRAEGRADDVSQVPSLGPDAIQGLTLGLQLTAPDSARLGSLLNMPLPAGFSISGDVALTGTSRLLQPASGRLRMISSDVQLELTPLGGLIRPFATTPLSGLRASASLSMSDTSALSQFLTRPVPSLGEVRGNALLSQSGGRLGLRDIDIALVGNEPALQLTGNIPDLGTLRGARLTTRYAGMSITTLLVTALQDLHYEAPLGSLQGQAEFINTGGRWDLSRFTAESAPPSGPLELQASGSIGDILGQPSANGRLRYAVRDTALLEALLKLPVKPASGSVEIISAPGTLSVSGRNRVGRTRLDSVTTVGWNNETIESLDVLLTSDLVYLEDFGLQASADSDYRPARQLEQAGVESFLQRLLTVPPQLTSDITLRVDGIRGTNTVINSLDLHTTGESNRYTLRRLNVGYGDTVAELRGIVDINASPPFVSIAGQGQGIPLRTLGRDLGMRSEVGGRLTVLGGLSAQGASAEHLLASSNGSVALALEDGTFEGAAYDLLATDLLGWLFSGASRERLTRIDCSMARFSLRNGVASSDSLYMETPQMVATGSGKIDLVARRMDVELTPRSRTRTLQVPATVRLRGPLDQPRVSVSPIAAAMDASAEFLSLLPRLARSVFGVSDSAKARQPCEAAR